MKILFSPIGNTDPVKYFHDGSMIHICRHYKPDKVYLYFSKEMGLHERGDGRNEISLKLLGEQSNHEFELEKIFRDDLEEAQQYDYFYRDFKSIIDDIESKMCSEDELLLNMASGTPAMKSALLVIATLNEYRYTPIQVSTPQKKSNVERDDREGENWEDIWECDEDNEADAPNRCEEVRCLNLMYLIKIDTIKKYLKEYDYAAALLLADEVREDMPEDAYELIKAAKSRVMLDLKELRAWEKKYDKKIVPSVDNFSTQRLVEYALFVQMKIMKEEYADYARAITPLVIGILERLLEKVTIYKINDLTTLSKTGVLKWNMEKLEQTGLKEKLDDVYRGGFKGDIVYSNHIAKVIELESSDVEVVRKVQNITAMEQEIRNIAAHEIQAVTNEWFIKKVNKSVEDTFRDIKYLSTVAGIVKYKELGSSDDVMNNTIMELLH